MFLDVIKNAISDVMSWRQYLSYPFTAFTPFLWVSSPQNRNIAGLGGGMGGGGGGVKGYTKKLKLKQN